MIVVAMVSVELHPLWSRPACLSDCPHDHVSRRDGDQPCYTGVVADHDAVKVTRTVTHHYNAGSVHLSGIRRVAQPAQCGAGALDRVSKAKLSR